MKFSVHAIAGLFAAFIAAAPAFANNASVTSSTTVVQDPRTQGDIFSGFLQASRSESLYDFQDGTRKDGMDYMARLNMKINKDYDLRLAGGFSQDLNNSDNDDFADTTLSLNRRPFALNRTFLLGWRLGLVAPTSKDSHIRQGLETSAQSGLTLMINPNRLIPGLGIVSGLSLNRNFHQYDTALDGSVNTEYTSAQSLSFSYDFPVGISMSADFVHKSGLTYQNNIKEAFEFTQELSYQISKAFAMAVGHTNSGSALKPNGMDTNYQLVDENNSLVYASFTVIF